MEQARIDMKNAMFSMSVWNIFNPNIVDKLQDSKQKQKFSIEEIIRWSHNWSVKKSNSANSQASLERSEEKPKAKSSLATPAIQQFKPQNPSPPTPQQQKIVK